MLPLAFVVAALSTGPLEHSLAPMGRFAAEAARINREREQDRADNDRLAKAMLSKGTELSQELSRRAERRRMLQQREQELFAQWSTTQKKLELQARGMMEELGESAEFVLTTRKGLDAAKAERSARLRQADDIEGQRRQLMERRKQLLAEKARVAAQLEEAAGNMTVLDAAKQRALTAAVQQADAVAAEETQLRSLEQESSRERGELWNLDLRLKSLTSRVNSSIDQSLHILPPGLVAAAAEASASPAPTSAAPTPTPTPLPTLATTLTSALAAVPVPTKTPTPTPVALSPSPSPIALFASSPSPSPASAA